jgi:ubiquitin
VFRRRRREDADQTTAGDSGADTAADGQDWVDDEETGDQAGTAGSGLSGGPWDADDAFPERDRADFGSLLVPVTPLQQIELATDGQRVIWVSVKSGQSELRVHAFAAPRSSGLWDEVRPEIESELASVGTTAQEIEGPFGTEMFAHVPVQPGNPAAGTVPMRFIGVDGPRWLLRGLIIGAAANGTEPAEPFEDILSDVVVVRGDGPMPPRDMLEIRLPAEIQQAIEQQQAAAAAQAAENETAGDEGEQPYQVDLNPFERGPEFTETR